MYGRQSAKARPGLTNIASFTPLRRIPGLAPALERGVNPPEAHAGSESSSETEQIILAMPRSLPDAALPY
jgi:hypothetical protein